MLMDSFTLFSTMFTILQSQNMTPDSPGSGFGQREGTHHFRCVYSLICRIFSHLPYILSFAVYSLICRCFISEVSGRFVLLCGQAIGSFRFDEKYNRML